MSMSNGSVKEELEKSFEFDEFFPFPRFEYTFPDPHPWPKDYKYRIAMIPMGIYPKNFDRLENGELRLVKIKDGLADDIADTILRTSRKAFESGAKIIVFSEFSYPISQYNKLNPELKRFCDETDTFVIAGSFHEIRTCDEDYGFSKCPIYDVQGNITYQYKNSSGSCGGRQEVIKPPKSRNLWVIHSRYGTFSVPICIDFLDANLHKNLNKLNKKGSLYRPIDLLIIPSYTDNSKMFCQACKKVSYDSNMCVIYLNNFHGEMSPEMFIGGNKTYGIYVNPREEGYPPIYLYDLDLIKIRELRLFGEYVEISKA